MSGYVPVFSTIYHGTLCGKWPAAPVWASLLPLADKHGEIDMTAEAIAGFTGWPLDLLRQGIAQLCEPDPASRSPDHDGRRLVLIDPEHRDWGWRVVNHGKYREKARLMGRDAARVASGENRERMAARRTPDDPRTPPRNPPHTHTQTHTQTQDKSAVALPDWLDKGAWREWVRYRAEIRKRLTDSTIRQQLALLEQQPNHAACIRQSIRNGWTGLFALKSGDIPEGPPVGDPAKEKANLDKLAGLIGGVKRVPK